MSPRTQALTFAIPLGVLVRRAALGLLPAPTDTQMSERGCRAGGPVTASPSLAALVPRWRPLVVAVVALVPPLATAARRTEYAGRTAVLAPRHRRPGAGRARRPVAPARAGGRRRAGGDPARIADRVADRRRRHRELPWSLAFIACDLGVAVAWHTPGAVARRGRATAGSWPSEAASLLVFGLGSLARAGGVATARAPLGAPPACRAGRLRHVGLLDPRLRDRPVQPRLLPQLLTTLAGGLSAAADQQIASAVLWFVAAAAFVPVIFWNALTWLQTEEDPDTELLALARAERRRGTPPLEPDGQAAAPAP